MVVVLVVRVRVMSTVQNGMVMWCVENRLEKLFFKCGRTDTEDGGRTDEKNTVC